MNAWGKANNAENKVLMVADSSCNFTKSIGAEINLDHKGLGIRSSRYAMLVEKGKIIKLSKEEVAGKCLHSLGKTGTNPARWREQLNPNV